MAGGDKNIWIVANWKSNKTISEALDWVSQVGPNLPKKDNLKIVVCPTFSALSEVNKAVMAGNYPLMIGCQDLSPFGTGAYTGAEPAYLIKDFIDLSILGHSERKKFFNESDEMVAKKVEKALENKIIPLVCIQDENTPLPSGVNMVAYEPVWAISTGLSNTPGIGRVDNPENTNEVAKVLKQKYGSNLTVIYGGSVDSGNVKGLISQESINGILVGNASLDAEEFIRILKEC